MMVERNRRYFDLPKINELSKEQESISYLASEGKYLVVGGPGTGKSVVALLRARQLADEKRKYLFLVYNVLLEKACCQLYPELKSARWISWFRKLYRKLFEEDPTPLSNMPGDIAWEEVEARILEADALSDSLKDKFLVIDEGQDMPKGFYETLDYLDAEHIFVTADQNQQITEVKSNIKEIRERLKLKVEEQIRLTENFRQKVKGYHVAMLADAFYPGDPASTRPELPPRNSIETPFLYTYEKNQFEGIINKIVLIVLRNPRELIGIITPNNEIRQRYFESLKSASDRLQTDDLKISVTTYHANLENNELDAIRFDRGGILVINAMACKGLEFDTVFIADVNDFYLDRDPNVTKRLFYTMISRSRERVFLLRRAWQACQVDVILPNDENILKRN